MPRPSAPRYPFTTIVVAFATLILLVPGMASAQSTPPPDVELFGGIGDAFGSVVAVVGDVNADGFTDYLFTAPTDDGVATASGQAYLFYGPLTGILIYLWVHWRMPRLRYLALALLLAGGVGNQIDRIANDGLVVDFLNFGLGPIRTGIFNFADTAITSGVVLLLLDYFQERRRRCRE